MNINCTEALQTAVALNQFLEQREVRVAAVLAKARLVRNPEDAIQAVLESNSKDIEFLAATIQSLALCISDMLGVESKNAMQ